MEIKEKEPQVQEAQAAEFAPLRRENPAGAAPRGERLGQLMKVDVEAMVSLGTASLKLSDVMNLEPGAVVTLEREVGQPVDLLVNHQVYATGVVVVVDGKYGLRITQLVGD